MLITSDTISPQRLGNGSPVANGRLYVRENSSNGSSRLELFRDYDCKESAPNPITLNSAGEIPYPVWTKASSAWCFLYVVKDCIEHFQRDYPLRDMPGNSDFKDPDKFKNLTAREKVKAKDIVNADRAINVKQSMQANSLEGETIVGRFGNTFNGSFTELKVGKLKPSYGEGTSSDVVISPAYIGTDDLDNNDPNKPEDWWKTFKLGSYGTVLVYSDGTSNHLWPKLNSIVEVKGIKDDTVMEIPFYEYGYDAKPTRAKCRICGLLGGPYDGDYRQYAYYLVCKVENIV